MGFMDEARSQASRGAGTLMGKEALISVPAPGAEVIDSSPPTSDTRSRIPSRPRLAPAAARSIAVSRSNPRPSSATRTSSLPAS